MSAVPDLDASGVSRARRRGLGMRFVVAAMAGLAVGLSWQPYGLWPLLLVGLPAFTLAVFGAQPARAPRLSNSVPATIPGLSKGHASRALSRAKDIGSRALSLWAGSDSVTRPAVLRAWLCFRFRDARRDDQLGARARCLDRVDPHRLRVALLRSARYSPASHVQVAGLAAGGRVLLGDDRVRLLPHSVRRLRMDAAGLRCGRHPAGRLPANHRRCRRVLSRRLDRSSPCVGRCRFRSQGIACRPPTGRRRSGLCDPGGDGTGAHFSFGRNRPWLESR